MAVGRQHGDETNVQSGSDESGVGRSRESVCRAASLVDVQAVGDDESGICMDVIAVAKTKTNNVDVHADTHTTSTMTHVGNHCEASKSSRLYQ